ncbi:hypothetical protein GGR20_001453 [Devosia subaequoris]|uniref:Uncharacterized protein n=1 Tax=Devosia subaequoris TaxID=395930 RepID=A0A7W6ILF9_9HYPH|nr:hypothetical protein [Devosia subaequoris]MBB4051811.1 hypothetical protein [Devosia subaequoris]MCP1210969.1 hypothetical protein [Devosia subaequoris]
MHKSTSPRRKSFRFLAVFGAIGSALSAAVLIMGVTPARAASFAAQPDTQIAVFMVPLTLLVLALLFEVARFAWRAPLPAQAPARIRRRPDWSTPGEGAPNP